MGQFFFDFWVVIVTNRRPSVGGIRDCRGESSVAISWPGRFQPDFAGHKNAQKDLQNCGAVRESQKKAHSGYGHEP